MSISLLLEKQKWENTNMKNKNMSREIMLSMMFVRLAPGVTGAIVCIKVLQLWAKRKHLLTINFICQIACHFISIISFHGWCYLEEKTRIYHIDHNNNNFHKNMKITPFRNELVIIIPHHRIVINYKKC